MWTVVFVSQDKQKVDLLLKLLEEKEIITMVHTSNEDDFSTGNTYEILVPQTELETAQEIIVDAEINGRK